MTKRSLAVLLAALAAAATSTSPAVAQGGCSLTAKAPKLLGPGEIRESGWARCSRTVRRSLSMSLTYVLTSGKKVGLDDNGVSGTFKSGVRKGWDGDWTSCDYVTDERHWRRYKDDLPVKVLIRMELYTHDFGKRLKRKDSVAVPLAELCPDFQPDPTPEPSA
jgi:hypothetical protein